MRKLSIVSFILIITALSAMATGRADSIPPFQLDAGVQARIAGDPLNAQCDVRYGTEPAHTITASNFLYSTDGQLSWNTIAASCVTGDRYAATSPSIPGDANWRFYIETDSCWGGQTALYSGAENCRLPANWYVTWDDNIGLDSSNSIPGGVGSWLDIHSAGFCISGTRFYAKMIMASGEFRKHDGDFSSVLQLYDHNYGYMFAINNPEEATGTVVFSMVYCDSLDPPEVGGSPPIEFAPGVLKVFDTDPQEIYVIDRDINYAFVAETMFVSCPISSITGDTDYGTYPNNSRYWNVQAVTMHLFWTGYWWDPTTVFYFSDETRHGHAYYNHNGSALQPWFSSPSAPNTPPLLTAPSSIYNDGPGQTTVTVTYSDADENPPEYVRVEIVSTRAVYDLQKAEVVGPKGWTEGIQYSTVIPGYHGFGADFTFSASDGADVFNLPAGPLAIGGELPERLSFMAYPNPFNSAITISLSVIPGLIRNPVIEVYDIAGRRVAEIPIDRSESAEPLSTKASSVFRWQPDETVSTGIYLVRASFGDEVRTARVVYMK